MAVFLKLTDIPEKEKSLRDAVSFHDSKLRYDVEVGEFKKIPGSPFAYWVGEHVRNIFEDGRQSDYLFKQGIATADDFRFLRLWWEVVNGEGTYKPIAKGGAFSPWYQDLDMVVNWSGDGAEIREFPKSRPQNIDFFDRPGITWPFRTQKGLNTRVLPKNSAFTIQGMGGFSKEDSEEDVFFLLGMTNSDTFKSLLLISVGFFAFQTGAMKKVPMPDVSLDLKREVASLAKKAWKLSALLDASNEISHFFILPKKILISLGFYKDYSQFDICDIQKRLNDIFSAAYGMTNKEVALSHEALASDVDEIGADEEIDKSEDFDDISILSWCIGVAFGRFEKGFGTGAIALPDIPGPFDPLPHSSLGMCEKATGGGSSGVGILVDDEFSGNDLVNKVCDIADDIQWMYGDGLRERLRNKFFKYHYELYSRSRRSAPIYWPLATASGSYTLWLYYPDLTDQTLFTAVNDFVEPKLKQLESELGNLRLAGASRSRADEKRLEELSDFRNELADLRDTLLRVAPDYKPHQDDGVQITAAPLWPLFRHRPWQNVLRETLEKLEQGDFDWAHLAMAYWPDRVREKCVTDKSLAIAHDLEHLYVEPEPAPKKARGRKKSTGSSE